MKWSAILLLVLAFSALAADPVELRLDRPQPRPPEAAVRELLSVICPGKVEGSRDNPRLPEEINAASRGFFSCPSCPEYTHPPFDSPWEAVAIQYGHFTAAGVDEAAVAMAGCESHVDLYGGTALFARLDDKWQMKWYQSGLITDDCLKASRRDGRDVLVCAGWDNHQGFLTHILEVVDFTQHERFGQDRILTLSENPETCGEELGGSKTIDPVQVANLRRVWFVPEPPRLEVTVEYGWRVLTAAEQSVCLAAVQKGQMTPAGLRPATKIYDLEFRFNGERFELRDEDAATLKLVETYPPVR